MIYIEAPNQPILLANKRKSLFLAGTIQNSTDWQAQVIEKIRILDIILFNPRRKVYPDNAAIQQITWEHQYLKAADAISFWFAKTSINPITLFELGSWIKTPKPLIIGVEPGYPRELDVFTQVGLERRGLKIVQTLDDLASGIYEVMNQLSTF